MATLNYDPKIPVYAAPKTSFTNVAAEKVAPPTQIVDKATGTVAGQLNGLLSAGSQYIDAAQSKAMRVGNSRGLLNSGMTAGEGTYAAINAATPIATSDANIYANLTSQNNQAANTASLNNQTAALDYGKSLTNAELNGALASQALAGTFEGKKLDSANALNLAGVNNAANLDLAGVNNAANLDLAGVNNAANLNIANVNNDSSMALQGLKNSASWNEAQLAAGTTTRGQDISAATTNRTTDVNSATNIELQGMKDANSVTLQGMSTSGQLALQNLTYRNNLSLQESKAGADLILEQYKGGVELQIKDMDISATAKTNLMGVVSNMGEQALNGITNVMLSKDLNTAAKQAAIEAIISSYTANATTAGAIAGINLSWGETPSIVPPSTAPASSGNVIDRPNASFGN